MLSFILSMPNVGSWNGKWTGEKDFYCLIKRESANVNNFELNGKSFYYKFGDGWGASVHVEKIDSKEAAKRKRKSQGFCGYDWMVSEILEHGKIITLEERRKKRETIIEEK